MKNMLKIALFVLAVAGFAACDDDNDTWVDPGKEVTPHNISGSWQLTTWRGEPLSEGSFVYMELTRKDKLFTIYQNLDSFGTRKVTGRYDIDLDLELGAVIMGQYEYGNGDWNHQYIVTGLTDDEMVWTAKDDAEDVSVYRRCTIPAEIAGAVAGE